MATYTHTNTHMYTYACMHTSVWGNDRFTEIIETKVTLWKERKNMVAIMCTMQIKLNANVHVCDYSD